MQRAGVRLLLVWLAAFGVGAPAAAATLDYSGTLTLDILDNLFVLSTGGSGQTEVDPATGAFSLEADQFVVSGMKGEFPPETPRDIIPEIIVGAENNFANAAGSFGPRAGGGFGGAMAVPGTFDFLGENDAILLTIFLDTIGVGGTISSSALGGLLQTHTVGAEWETTMVTVDDVIVNEVPGQSVSRTGYDMRGPDGRGLLRLVTPVHMTIDGSGAGFFVQVPTFATLDLLFVPEPGTGALVACGLVAMAARRRGRVRR